MFFIIIFVFHCIYKRAQQFHWQGICLVNAGTWVRFPGPPICLIIFVSMCSSAALIPWPTIYAHAYACQVALMSNPMVRRWILWCTPVNNHTHDQKSQTSLCFSGPELLQSYLHNGPDTPLVCIFSFSFSF